MINILMSGCNGSMGQVICRLSKEYKNLKIAAGLDINDDKKNDFPVYTSSNSIKERIDCIIDFSHPSALDNVLNYATKNKIPAVIATTGLSTEQIASIKEASNDTAILFSANMSLGVNLLIDLVQKAAKILEGAFDIEIVEKHHNKKIDAPSGTALALADAINSSLSDNYKYVYDRHSRRAKREKTEIGIHAVRGGTIAGEHDVIFAGNDEIIELKHTAISKEVFATGALKAALFLAGKEPGFYSMKSLLDI